MVAMEPIVAPEQAVAKAAQESAAPELLNTPVVSDPSVETAPIEGTGPILGVAPEEVQGTAITDKGTARQATGEVEQTAESRLPWQVSTALGLFGLALTLLVASFILKRKILG